MNKKMNFDLTRAREQELKRTKKNILLERIALAFVVPYLLGRLSVRVPGNVRKRIKDKKPVSGEFKKPFIKTKKFAEEIIHESGNDLNKLYERYAQEDAEMQRLEREEINNRTIARQKGIYDIIEIMRKKIVSVDNQKGEIKVVLDNGSKIIFNQSELTVSDFLGGGNSVELSAYEYNLLKGAVKRIYNNVESFNMLTQKNKMLYTITKERKL